MSDRAATSPPRVTHLVIIAGGSGSRLSTIAGALPKALVPIGGKPILQHQVELAAGTGVQDVTVFGGHGAERIAEFVGDGSRFGLRVRVVKESRPLGTAGGVLQALDSLPDHFFVLYGDLMLAIHLERMAKWHLDRAADFTVLAQPTDHPHDSDLLEADDHDRVTAIHLCPHPDGHTFGNLANAALYTVRRDALRPWAASGGTSDFIRDVMAGLVAGGGRVLAYRSNEYIRDMGTPDRLQRVEADWQAGAS
jgi:NDP-sugar pyrophosphorylase family protein